ncbi:MAG: ThuA domain-containing protein, partial [Planctomycetes bacterium]|nr:ThuA domain-containing protein [Planctomycetota bacterium]
PYIADDALKAEAATAMIKIAEAISFDFRQETEAVLREVAETCKDEAVQKQVADALRRIGQYDDHITAWLVSKSYTEKKKNNKQLFDIEFEPEKPDAKNVKWTAICGGKDRSKAWKVDLREFDNGSNRVAYLRSWVRSDKEQKARLEIGSDDGVKVWLNGAVSHTQNVNRALAVGQDKVEVALKEGWNDLMLKVTQGGADWAASVRVRAADGSALPGVLLLGDPKALQAAASDLGNGDQRTQAAEILTKMVDAISVVYPDETKAALKKAAELAKDDSVRKEISGLLDKSSKFEDYITTWQLSGPHLQDGVDGKSLFDVAFPPENPDHAGATWSPMPANLDPKQPWCMLIEKALGGDHRAAYLRTYVWSPKKQDARLELGSDDGLKVWLNGEVVHANNALRAIGPAQDKVNVTLREGWNSLLLKITQSGGHWAACARFRDPNGFHLDGLKTQAETPPGMKFVPIPPKELPKPAPAAKAPAKAEPEKPKPVPTEADIKKMTDAMPSQARVKPVKLRKLLVFSACTGHAHGSIPWCAKAFEIMGKKTGAFEAVVSDDVANFEPDKIQQFDAICFNNTTGNFFQPRDLGKLPKEQQDAAKARDERAKKSLLDFVAGGKGIVGIHAATDAQYQQWADYGKLMGGYFSGHPWNEVVTVKIDDPGHPVNAAFQGKSFEVADEIYQFKDPYSREALRVLLSLDTAKTKMDKGDKIRRTDGDFAVSWVRSYGKGRVFYCSLGHRNEIFWNPTVLQHYLDGIQFAFGDLQADTTPSAALAR